MYFTLIDFGTPAFDEILHLRDRVLRRPLNMVFHESDISTEWGQIHLAAYDNEDNLLACLVLKPIGDTVMKMRQVAVDPDLQGHGIGSMLVKESETICMDLKYSLIELNARDTAISFYENMDYHKVGERFIEVGIDHFKMQKQLNG